MRRQRQASSRSSPAAGSRCQVRVEEDVLRDAERASAEEMMEWRGLFILEHESSTTSGCCWGSGGGDEQGVIASSSSLKEAFAVMERRLLLWSRCDSAIVLNRLCGRLVSEE